MMLFFFLVCDPVLGDEGKLYVPPELVEVYREKVSSSSVTPVGMHMFYSILESWARFEISGLCGSNMQNFTLN